MAYTVNDIGANYAIYAINQNATSLADVVAVGFDILTNEAFVYQSAVVTALPSLSGAVAGDGGTLIAAATSVSADGTVLAGLSYDSGSVARPVYWQKSAGVWTIYALTEPVGYEGTLNVVQNNIDNPNSILFGAHVSQDGGHFVAAYGQAASSFVPSVMAVWTGGTPSTLSIGSDYLYYSSTGVSLNAATVFSSYVTTVSAITPNYWSGGPSSDLPVTLPNTYQFVQMSSFSASNDGTIGVYSGYDAHTETRIGVYYSSGTLNLLETPPNSTGFMAFGCTATGANIVGSGDGGAVLWVAGVSELLPVLSGATSDGTYQAWSISANSNVIGGFGNDAAAALHGIIWTTEILPPGTPVNLRCG